jgi:hypothetical protein
MQKCMVISLFLLLVMNGNIMGMQIFRKLHGDQKYLISSIKRSITSTYYGSMSKSDNHPTTFTISQLAIKIKILEHEKKELENKGIHNLRDEETIGRYEMIRMHEDSIDRNKILLRKLLDDLCKSKSTAKE